MGAINVPQPGRFVSAEQVITTAGALTIAHGLGIAPRLVTGRLKCLTADNDYSVGDIVHLSTVENGGASRGVSVVADAANLVCRFGSEAYVFAVPNKVTGLGTVLVNANWKLILEASL